MSEQLGFLILLLVVGTGNLLLGFVLAAHLGRLQLTWISMEFPAEEVRAFISTWFGWITAYVPFLKRKTAAAPTAEVDSHRESNHAAEHKEATDHKETVEHPPVEPNGPPESTVDYVEVEEKPAPAAEAPPPAPMTDIVGQTTVEKEPVKVAAEFPASPLAEVTPAEPAARPAAPTESELRTIARLAAEQKREEKHEQMEPPLPIAEEKPAVPPLPSFEELASQMEGEMAQLREEMSKVLRPAPDDTSVSSSGPRESGNSMVAESSDSQPSYPCAIPDEASWEAQLQNALHDNLAELQAAAKALQAAEPAHS